MMTAASIWKFDLDRLMYVRFPRGESPDSGHTIPYTCMWEPFIELVRNGKHLIVVRPVPYGEGQLRQTGVILTDTHPEDDELVSEAQ